MTTTHDITALLGACCHQRDADDLRLFLADALEDGSDDAWGELIRLQVKVSQPPWNSKDMIRIAELLRDEAKLRRGALAERTKVEVSGKGPQGFMWKYRIRSWSPWPLVELPLAECGEEERCSCRMYGRDGYVLNFKGKWETCVKCSGTGRIWQPSPLAIQLVREMGAVLWVSDKRPYRANNSEYFWLHPNAATDDEVRSTLPGTVWNSDVLSRVVNEKFNHRRANAFSSVDAAHLALSTAITEAAVEAAWPKLK